MKRLLIVIGVIFGVMSCQIQKERIFKRSEILMDTIVTVTVVADSETEATQAIDMVFRELKRLEDLFSAYKVDSEITRLNQAAGREWIELSPVTVELLTKGKEIARLTRGTFDMTIGVVSLLYDFQKGIVPEKQEIQKRLSLVGYEKLRIKGRKAFLEQPGMRVDPGGIAKGFAVDRAIHVLKARGIKGALVAVAGDIRGYGQKPDGSPWVVGIRDPYGDRDDVFAIITLKNDTAVSTSGNYERFFYKNGKRYHHILDPRTGLPAEGLRSVTVIGPEGVFTDSLATAVFIMGLKDGIALAEGLGYYVIAVDEQGRLIMSRSLEGVVKVLHRPGQR